MTIIEKVHAMNLDELREVYVATFGIYPNKNNFHYNNREHYIALFEREVKFGRNLNRYSGSSVVTITDDAPTSLFDLMKVTF